MALHPCTHSLFLAFLHLYFPGPGACVPYFSLSFSILAIFFLMAACHLPCRRPLAWLINFQRHPVFLSTLFFGCFPRIGVLATRFRTIFRRLLSSGHRLCLKGWVVVAALVGSPCWRVIAYLNWLRVLRCCVLSRPLAALARATVCNIGVKCVLALNEDERRLLGTSSSYLGLSYLPTTCAVGNQSLCGSRHPGLTALGMVSKLAERRSEIR